MVSKYINLQPANVPVRRAGVPFGTYEVFVTVSE